MTLFVTLRAVFRKLLEQALMVGDTWDADIVGARSAGIQALHLKRDDAVDESLDEISTLHGVINFLKHQP